MFTLPEESGITTVNFILPDTADPLSEACLKGSVNQSAGGHFLEIILEGYGEKTAATGCGAVCVLEYRDGKPKLLVFSDITEEDPTAIDLSGAKEHLRELEDDPEKQIGLFAVVVSKGYYRTRSPERERTVFGSITVRAKDKDDACLIVRKMMAASDGDTLQTVDPRITWEEELPSCDWEYSDFSFQVEDDLDAEDLDTSVPLAMWVKVEQIDWDTDGMEAVADCGLPLETTVAIDRSTNLSLLSEAVGIKLHDTHGFKPHGFKIVVGSS